MLRIALRAHRTGFLVAALIVFLDTAVQSGAYSAGAGHTPIGRAAFGHQMSVLATQVAYLIPLPVHPESLGGYVQWRAYGFLGVMVGFWALLAATGAIRNEEERGLLEVWLAASVGRMRLVAVRSAAFALAAAGVVLAGTVGALAGAASVRETLDLTGLMEVSLALWALVLCCFGAGLLAAQLAGSRRGAMALGGISLLALFLLDSAARLHSLHGWERLSPFSLYNGTTALAPGGRFDAPATGALVGIAVALSASSALAFRRRDLLAPLWRRGPVARRAVFAPSGNPLLRIPVLSALYEQRVGLAAWLAGTALIGAYMTSLTRAAGDLLRSYPAYFRFAGTHDPNLLMLGLFWFGIAGLLVVIYAILQVSRWAADDAEGRLEMMIAQPIPRWRVVAERFWTLAVAAAALATMGSIVVAVGAPSQGVHLDAGRFVLATALLVPMALAFGALGAALIARVPRLAVPVLSALAVAGYFLLQLGPLFKWPDWALDLSVFRLYGNPLTEGVNWPGLWTLTVVIVAGTAVGVMAMRYREVGS